MKNQYVGDIGDYGKYGLLRFLAEKGVRIGVNWYLTENDKTTDGNKTEYLNESNYGCYDEELFEKLRPIAQRRKTEKEYTMSRTPKSFRTQFSTKKCSNQQTKQQGKCGIRKRWTRCVTLI